MIGLDYSQICISTVMTQLGDAGKKRSTENANLIKHMIFVTLLSHKKRYHKQFGDVVIACDSRNGYWRKQVFPFYKYRRSLGRDDSDFDWEFIFEIMDDVKTTLKAVFPWKVIEVDGAEADDIFACLSKYLQTNDLNEVSVFDAEPQLIKIISSDGDMVQLQKYKNVSQFNPMLKKEVKPNMDLKEYIIEHIVRGDGGDDVPNILSPDNTFVDKIRQKPVTAKYLETFYELMRQGKDPIDACRDETERTRYKRNKQLVNFEDIPDDIYNAIIKQYQEQKPVKNQNAMMQYFIANRMAKLLADIKDF